MHRLGTIHFSCHVFKLASGINLLKADAVRQQSNVLPIPQQSLSALRCPQHNEKPALPDFLRKPLAKVCGNQVQTLNLQVPYSFSVLHNQLSKNIVYHSSTHPFCKITFAYWLVSPVATMAYAFFASS